MTEQLPNMTPFESITLDLDEALDLARGVSEAKTQEQADDIAEIIDRLKDGAKLLEAERVKVRKPHDDAIEKIQSDYNPYIAPLKNKGVKGKVPLAIEALNAAKKPFLLEQERKLEEQRRAARAEAERLAREAAEEARAASASDLEAREEAEAKEREAQAASKAAKDADKAKAHAHGGGRAQGLRTVHKGRIDDLNTVVKFYWQTNEAAFAELVQKLVDADVRAGRRGNSIPGVTIIEERV